MNEKSNAFPEIKLTDADAVILLDSIADKLKKFQRIGADYTRIIVCQENWSVWVGLEIQAVQRAIDILKKEANNERND